MRFRKLRIAWSVFWGLACGVLTLVWLWSYWYSLAIYQYSPGEVSGISLYFGEVTAFKWHGTFVGAPDWRVEPTYERTPKKGLASFLVPRFQVRPNLGIPLWFFMLLFSAAIGVPWIKWRFGLRTLLIATTLVAVVLALAVYATAR